MSVLGSQAPAHEVYSIDECFLDLDQIAVPSLTEWCRDLRQQTHQWTGIPVSIGVGPTKTLAKVANRLAVQLFVRTDPFDQNAPQKSVSGSATFQRPTSDTREIVGAVLRVFERIWREGYGWRKAGVLLLDLGDPAHIPTSLFDVIEQPDGLMNALDQINARFGRGKARLGLAGKNAEWRMRQENLSPSFTTRWDDIPAVKSG